MSAAVDAVEPGDQCWLRVRIFGRKKDEGAVYPIEAELDDGSWYAGRLNLDEAAMTELLALESEAEVSRYGVNLGRLLFDSIKEAFLRGCERSRETASGRLRVQLWISPECSELHAFMWERVFVESQGQLVSLSSSDWTPFSRFTRLSKAEPKAITARPLKLLVAVANPTSLPPAFEAIDVGKEIENLAAALADVSDLTVTIMPGRTGIPEALRQSLLSKGCLIDDGPTTPEALQLQLASHHVLHYLGHGTFIRDKKPEGGKARSGKSYLLLEDEQGDFQQVSDEELVARLAAFRDIPRLIFLASCDTAKRDPQDPHPFVGLGPKLVEAGFPAVVAMQDKVPMALARSLTLFFYRHLLNHGLIDQALNESRKFLLDEQHPDWAIPVLFMRTPGGRLFAPNPVREALARIKDAPLFQPRWQYGHLPLEAVLLTGKQTRSTNWELVAQQTQARVDLWSQTLEILRPDKKEIVSLAITGERGMARSTHLRRLMLHTAVQSWGNPEQLQVLPVYLDLTRLLDRTDQFVDFLAMFADSLNPYWPGGINKEQAEKLLIDDDPKLRLRVIVDNLEDLPEAQHRLAIEELQRSIKRYFGHHQLVMAFGHGGNETKNLLITHLLDIQPMSRRGIQKFLRDLIGRSDGTAQEDAAAIELGERLATALEKTQMFDLAAQPWLMVRIVERAQEEVPRIQENEVWPPSRALLLREVVEDKVQRVSREHGMQARALETMYVLARIMQFSGRHSLPLQEALPAMAVARGDREYKLDELLDQLSRAELMAIYGNEELRFLYLPLQAYCCAQSLLGDLPPGHSAQFWEKIASGLGGINQVRRWFDTLVLLSGLLTNPDELLDQVIYGESFGETEKVFLAARCLLESDRVREHRAIRAATQAETMTDQLRDALTWLLRQQRRAAGTNKLTEQVSKTLLNLINSYRREKRKINGAVADAKPEQPDSAKNEAGQLLDALRNLLERGQIVGSRYVADRVMESLIWRSSSVNEPRSYQRLRAIEELGRLRRPEIVSYLARVAMTRVRVTWGKTLKFEYGGIRQSAGRALRRMMPEFEADLKQLDPALVAVIELWRGRKIDELTILLRKTRRQCTAEQIREGVPEMAAFALGDIRTDSARQVLYQTFLDRKTSPDTRWAIADALTGFDPEEVTNEILNKLIPTTEELEDNRYQISQAPHSRWFEILIYLIGELRSYDQLNRKFIERFIRDPRVSFALKGRAILAVGNLGLQEWSDELEQVALGNFSAVNLDQRQFRRADPYLKIKALQGLSQIGDRETLRRLRDHHQDWSPEVERTFYMMSEEINWRLSA